MKAYFENCIELGRARAQLQPAQMAAVQSLLKARDQGKLEIVTSRETHREQDRTGNPAKRAQLVAARGVFRWLPATTSQLPQPDGSLGTVCATPMITEYVDEDLFSSFTKAGLKEADARHLMYAVHNGCDRFL